MSGIGTGTALMIGGLAGAGGSLASGFMGSNAANNAADAQSAAANHAADLQYQASQNALNFEKQQWGQSQANMAPWLASGASALGNLDYLLGLAPPTTQGAMTGNPQFGGGFGGGSAPGGMPPIGVRPQSGGSFPGATGGPIQSPGSPQNTLSGVGRAYGGPVMAPGGPQSQRTPLGVAAQPGMQTNYPGGIGSPSLPPGYASPANAQGSGPVRFGSGGGSGQPSGSTNLGSAVNPNLGGFGSLMQANPYSTFTAPTALTEQNDPGYQARLKLGQDALERSAAARGNVLTGGTAQAENQAAQDFASGEYNQVFNRAFNTNAANFNQYNLNRQALLSPLESLAGIGQTSAQQLGYMGNAAAGEVGNNLMSTANMMGQDYQNAAAANASGIYNSAGAWGNAMNGMGSNLMQMLMMRNMMGGGGAADAGAANNFYGNYGY